MSINKIVEDFKLHQLQYGLGGDPEQDELYKWKLVTDQIGHPDVNAVDFSKEINSLSLKNLCYSTQTTAIRHFVEYEPEEYRNAFIGLFDENIDLQERVDKFISDCRELWDNKIKQNFTQKTSAMCDERLISFFLTLMDPTKYTFYKDEDIYRGFQPCLTRKATQKLEQTTLPTESISSCEINDTRPVDCVGLPPDFSTIMSPACKHLVSNDCWLMYRVGI